MSTFSGTRTDGVLEIDSIMVQEANRIGSDIHAENVHTSPWMDLIPKGTFPEGMGYRLQSLIYERSLPTSMVLSLMMPQVGSQHWSLSYGLPEAP